MDIFLKKLKETTDSELIEFCRRHALHGTPAVFKGNEDNYYLFRRRISENFEIGFHEVFITGSAKLGFSPFKKKLFDYDSDIDVAIVSGKLYEKIMTSIYSYQMELRDNRKAVTEKELERYHKFLEYSAIGWMRPDLLPSAFRIKDLRASWFDFFNSISYDRSEVGNYKVSAGAFKSYEHLEKYIVSGFGSVRNKLNLEGVK